MTAADESDDLALLEQTRSRLETALSRDEHWRALTLSSAQSGGAEDAARRARNKRLEMALAENPFFRAWKHVSEAIEALRERAAADAAVNAPITEPAEVPIEPGVEPSIETGLVTGADAGAAPPARSGLAERIAAEAGDAFELPKDILDLIRAGSPDAAAPGQPSEPDEAAVPGPAAARSRVVIPSVAAASGKAEGQGASQARRAPAREAPAWEEASVTFVTREARTAPPAEGLPADPGAERAPVLFARPRNAKRQAEAGDETPPGPDEEEAEVSIITPEMKEAQRKAEEAAAKVRRLRKALSGD